MRYNEYNRTAATKVAAVVKVVMTVVQTFTAVYLSLNIGRWVSNINLDLKLYIEVAGH